MKARVACVGTGLIGKGWASVFLAGGLDVAVFDAKEGAAERALGPIRETAGFIQRSGLSPSKALGRIRAAATMEEAVEGRAYVQESVFESYAVKRKVFREASSLNPRAIIASSTSSLSITEMQRSAKDPSRCISVHPLNPVYIVPVVEVVGGKLTSKATVEEAGELMKGVGKVPVTLNFEVPGHILDRLQAVIWREALDLVARGVAEPEEIDKAMASGLGPRWAALGPFLRAHLAGGEGGLEYYFEHIEPSHYHIWKDTRTWKRAPSKAKSRALASLDRLTAGRSYEEMVKRRDELLLKLIKDAERGR